MDNVIYKIDHQKFFNIIQESQADNIALNVHRMPKSLVAYFTAFFKKNYRKHNIAFEQGKFNQILDICSHVYRARWLMCQSYEQQFLNEHYSKKGVCKVMNYLRFNKCVEYSYVELMNENAVVMNLGYSNLEVMNDLGSKFKVPMDSSEFFKDLMMKLKLKKIVDKNLSSVLNNKKYSLNVIIGYENPNFS